MNITKVPNTTNFQSHFLNQVQLKKFDKNYNKFINENANFVILDGKNKFDLNAVSFALKKWKGANDLMNRIDTLAHWSSLLRDVNVYVITSQSKNFDKLNPKNILGFAGVKEIDKTSIELSYLQVSPKAANVNVKMPNSKGVGKAILKSLKNLYDYIELDSINDENTKKFYRHNGFVETENGHFVWKRCILIKLIKYLHNAVTIF